MMNENTARSLVEKFRTEGVVGHPIRVSDAVAAVRAAAVLPARSADDRTIEILRRALAWHGNLVRMAKTREEWQQTIDEAIVWVKENPEPGYASFPTDWLAFTEDADGAPLATDLTMEDYSYDELWGAIAAATRIDGGIVAISVVKFREAIRSIDRPVNQADVQQDEGIAWRLDRIRDDGGPLTASDKGVLREASDLLRSIRPPAQAGAVSGEARPHCADCWIGTPGHTCSSHTSATPAASGEIPAGMVAWHGGDSAPADWDRGPVLREDGTMEEGRDITQQQWRRPVPRCRFNVIAYTPITTPKASAETGVAGERLVQELRPLIEAAAGPNGWDWMFPIRVKPVDGKPTIVSHKGGNLFRGYIGTWQEADLLVGLANAAPRILAALSAAPSAPATE